MPLPQLVSILGTPPSMHFGHFTGRLGSTCRTRISVISLLKFNFLSPLTHCTFSCNFDNTVAEIQSLSLFCQISLNNTYNNNKLRFFAIFSEKIPLLSFSFHFFISSPPFPLHSSPHPSLTFALFHFKVLNRSSWSVEEVLAMVEVADRRDPTSSPARPALSPTGYHSTSLCLLS